MDARRVRQLARRAVRLADAWAAENTRYHYERQRDAIEEVCRCEFGSEFYWLVLEQFLRILRGRERG